MLLKIFPKYTLTISITSESRVPNASKKIVFSKKNSWRRACLMEAPVSGTSTAFHPPREFLFSRLFAPRNYPKLMFIIPPRVFVALPGEKWLDINLTARLLGNMLCQIVYIISAFPSLNPDLRMTVMRITNQVWKKVPDLKCMMRSNTAEEVGEWLMLKIKLLFYSCFWSWW